MLLSLSLRMAKHIHTSFVLLCFIGYNLTVNAIKHDKVPRW